MSDQSTETSNEANSVKKMKIDNEQNSKSNGSSVHKLELLKLSDFEMKRLLDSNAFRKTIFIEGSFKGLDSPAVIILEKKSFPEEEIFLKRGFFNEGTIIRKVNCNDVYGKYECFPTREHNGLNATIIHPATEKHIEKYLRKEVYLVEESYETYKNITLPYIMSAQFSMEWIDNIIEGKAEQEKVIYQDKDKETGFLMLPDLKWDGNPRSLYILALANKRIKSIRELNETHLPLLRNMKEKGCEAIKKKFNLSPSQLRIYFHYQPSYYHLHIHFVYLDYESPGAVVEKAVLLNTVISNIELMSDYYQKVTLSFPLKENDPLFQKYEESGIITINRNQGNGAPITK